MSGYRTEHPKKKRHEAFLQEIFIDMPKWEATDDQNAELMDIDELFRNLFDEEDSDEEMWF